MKRLHVHVSVDDLAASIQFYSSLFSHEPTVQKTDYAKWMLDDPRVNFAISQRGGPAGLNHLGIQVESSTELSHMQSRLESLQPDLEMEEGVACCYAKSDKYWVTDPQGIPWETFHTLESIPVFGEKSEDESAKVSTQMHSANPASSASCVPVARPMLQPMQQAKSSCVPSSNPADKDPTTTGKCC